MLAGGVQRNVCGWRINGNSPHLLNFLHSELLFVKNSLIISRDTICILTSLILVFLCYRCRFGLPQSSTIILVFSKAEIHVVSTIYFDWVVKKLVGNFIILSVALTLIVYLINSSSSDNLRHYHEWFGGVLIAMLIRYFEWFFICLFAYLLKLLWDGIAYRLCGMMQILILILLSF